MLQHHREIILPNEVLFSEVRKLLTAGHTVTIRVRGHSMLPLLHNRRDRVILASCSKPIAGSIVLAEVTPTCYVLHRIINQSGDGLTLMGDGNLTGGETCLERNVVGVVVAIIRNDRELRLGGVWWRIYSWWWTFLRPIRRYLLAIYRRI